MLRESLRQVKNGFNCVHIIFLLTRTKLANVLLRRNAAVEAMRCIMEAIEHMVGFEYEIVEFCLARAHTSFQLGERDEDDTATQECAFRTLVRAAQALWPQVRKVVVFLFFLIIFF